MASVSSIAQSGMQAAQTSLNVSAHNVANLSTAGFRRQEAVRSEQPSGGVSTTVNQTSVQGADLASDVVNQLQAKNAFLANLAVFKTHDKMAGALLNTKA